MSGILVRAGGKDIFYRCRKYSLLEFNCHLQLSDNKQPRMTPLQKKRSHKIEEVSEVWTLSLIILEAKQVNLSLFHQDFALFLKFISKIGCEPYR